MASWQRTHTCGELREAHVGQVVVLNGWVNTYRDQKHQIFIDLRDRYGITQIVFDSEDQSLFSLAQELRSEFVLAVEGTVRARLPGKTNPKLATGAIEIKAEKLTILNRCPTLPFEVTEFTTDEAANEDLRLQYRFIDLRRSTLQRILILRHRLNKAIRDNLDSQGFLELETPLLGRSTPEGARDYLVPSRVHPGNWYALPQSPQLYKQLLMVAGYDKYFQIAHCLRDEDLRADRQPEFTQLDLEMSFVEMDDVFRVIEKLVADVFKQCIGVDIPLPLPRLKYADAMLKYGSDKPDLRYGLEIVDVTDVPGLETLNVFQAVLAEKGVIRGIRVPETSIRDKSFNTGQFQEFVQRFGAKGLLYVRQEMDKLRSNFAKNLPAESFSIMMNKFGAAVGDLVLLVADKEPVVCQSLGNLRVRIAEQFKLYDAEKGDYKIAWIYDFPSFIWDDEEKRWAANHHPFTAPMDEDLHKLESDPGSVRAKAYDLVINGYECGGGSIRIHNPEVQSRVFRVLGMNDEQASQRFGFLLDALRMGAPPHGGIALGLDRWTMMLARTTNIRDVIAFPKNQKARDLMTGAPAPVDAKQLKELGL